MSVVSFGDRNVVVGLNWLDPGAITNNAREATVRRRLRTLDANPTGYASIVTLDGLQHGITSSIRDIGLDSAAAWLATVVTSAILVEKLDKDRYWLCAVENGVVYPSGDIIGNKHQIALRLEELLIDTKGSTISIYDKESDFAEFVNGEKTGFSELVLGTTPDSRGKCRLLRNRVSRKAMFFVTGIVAFSMLGASGWYFFGDLFTSQFSKKVSTQQELRLTAIQAEKSALEQELTQDAGLLLASFVDLIYDRPIRLGGWQVIAYEWKNGIVISKWKRSYGTINDLTTQLTSKTWSLNESTGEIFEELALPVPSASESFPLSRLGNITKRHKFLDMLSTTPGNWKLTESKENGKYFKYRKSYLSGSSSSLRVAGQAARSLLNQPINVTLLKANLGRKNSWLIEGAYYEVAR